MKNKDAFNFLAGFLITAVVTAWLYWLWQQRREVTPKPLVVSSRQPARESMPQPTRSPAPVAPQPEPDDLTAIKGIGPVFARRLNEAGIYTYAQLAAQTVDMVQAVIQVTRGDTADWIAEAKRLA